MKILVTGSSGFIGQSLCRYLLSLNHEVLAYSHTKSRNQPNVEGIIQLYSDSIFPPVDAIVNLGGESIYKRRLSSSRIKEILASRIDLIKLLKQKYKTNFPMIFIQASATGIYANGNDLNEKSSLKDDTFADICKAVEDEAQAVKTLNKDCHVILARIGVVLGSGGGLFRILQFLPKLHFFNAENCVPYINLDDLIHAFVFCIENRLEGVVNMCSPDYLSLNSILQMSHLKNTFLPTLYLPLFILKLDKRGSLMLVNQRLEPSVLMNNGFKFQ